MNKNIKNILICPLEWGLGHATRCIPIIKTLQKLKYNLIIAGEGRSGKLLKKEFPELTHIDLPGYNIQYPSGNFMEIAMLIQIPKIFYRIYREHVILNSIIKVHNIDAVISDNRFGLWNKQTYSIYMTHQILTKCPWFMKFMEYPVYLLHQFFIRQYDECWIPDYFGKHSLAGDLSNKARPNKKTSFIGILSRLNKVQEQEIVYDLIAILSGPEPQRTSFEANIHRQLIRLNKKALIVSGKAEGNNSIIKVSENISRVDFLNSSELAKAISKSEIVLCRSGYSSIMDMIHLGKKAILIPTKGQTEQEYLAKYLAKQKYFPYMTQNEARLSEVLKKMEDYCPPNINCSFNLEEKIQKLF